MGGGAGGRSDGRAGGRAPGRRVSVGQAVERPQRSVGRPDGRSSGWLSGPAPGGGRSVGRTGGRLVLTAYVDRLLMTAYYWPTAGHVLWAVLRAAHCAALTAGRLVLAPGRWPSTPEPILLAADCWPPMSGCGWGVRAVGTRRLRLGRNWRGVTFEGWAGRPPEAVAGKGGALAKALRSVWRGSNKSCGRATPSGRSASCAGAFRPGPSRSNATPASQLARMPPGAPSALRAGLCNRALLATPGWARARAPLP